MQTQLESNALVDFGWPAAVLCFAARLYELVRAHLVVRVKFALRQLVDDSLRNRVRVCSNDMIQCVSKGGADTTQWVCSLSSVSSALALATPTASDGFN